MCEPTLQEADVLAPTRFSRREIDGLLDQINSTGYGQHDGATRANRRDDRAPSGAAYVANVSVYWNVVEAVVGVHPFGGEGLTSTGPKAGVPVYLYRLLVARPVEVLARAIGGDRLFPSRWMENAQLELGLLPCQQCLAR